MIKLFIISLLLTGATTAKAAQVEINLKAQFWAKQNKIIKLIGEAQPLNTILGEGARTEVPFIEAEIKRVYFETGELKAEVIMILVPKSEKFPEHLIFQTKLMDHTGLLISQCSNYSAVLPGNLYGVGACAGLRGVDQVGFTLSL